MLARALETKIPSHYITVIDTDLQRTTTEFLSSSNPEINIEFLPITPAFENTQHILLQQFIKQNSYKNGHVVIINHTGWNITEIMEPCWRKLLCFNTYFIK